MDKPILENIRILNEVLQYAYDHGYPRLGHSPVSSLQQDIILLEDRVDDLRCKLVERNEQI